MRTYGLIAPMVLVLAGAGAGAPPQRKPNLSLNVYRRCFTLDEPVQLSVGTFNAPVVQFTARRFDLKPVLARAGTRWDMGNLVRDVPTGGLPVQATWSYKPKRAYPDMWASGSTKAPRLGPFGGERVVRARDPRALHHPARCPFNDICARSQPGRLR